MKEKGKSKRHYGAKHIVSFLMVGDNRIELLTFPAELIAHIGDLWGIRTPEPAVKGRCLNHLTNRPLAPEAGFEPATS